MGLLIVKSDFVGKYALATSTKSNDNIDAYIAEYEEQILIDLLGLELFELFKADVDSGTKKPETPIYLTLYDRLNFEYCNSLLTSFGLKNILLSIIYFYYVRDNTKKQTLNGDQKIQSEVSDPANQSYLLLRYNEGVKSYKAIQRYLLNNEAETYPTFKGTPKHIASLI
jgi:hypothetical protein